MIFIFLTFLQVVSLITLFFYRRSFKDWLFPPTEYIKSKCLLFPEFEENRRKAGFLFDSLALVAFICLILHDLALKVNFIDNPELLDAFIAMGNPIHRPIDFDDAFYGPFENKLFNITVFSNCMQSMDCIRSINAQNVHHIQNLAKICKEFNLIKAESIANLAIVEKLKISASVQMQYLKDLAEIEYNIKLLDLDLQSSTWKQGVAKFELSSKLFNIGTFLNSNYADFARIADLQSFKWEGINSKNILEMSESFNIKHQVDLGKISTLEEIANLEKEVMNIYAFNSVQIVDLAKSADLANEKNLAKLTDLAKLANLSGFSNLSNLARLEVIVNIAELADLEKTVQFADINKILQIEKFAEFADLKKLETVVKVVSLKDIENLEDFSSLLDEENTQEIIKFIKFVIVK